jgi:hypothetical protein
MGKITTNGPALQLDTIVTRADGVVTSNLDGEVVMMSIDRGKYYGLDAIASQIWELLETPCSIRALCDQLLPQYDVGRQQGEVDVLGFCQQAREQGIIRILDTE